VQRHASGAGPSDTAVHDAAARGVATPSSQLPYADQIQRLFGRHDISSVKAHTGSDAAATAKAMGADAYATGDHVVLGDSSNLHTAAHEAAHVIQQRGSVQLKGGVGEVGDPYERHADAVADAVVQGKSAEPLLDRFAATSGGAGGTGAAVQQVREIDTGGKVFTQDDAAQKRLLYGRIVQNLHSKLAAASNTPQAAALQAQIQKLNDALAKYDLAPNTEAFVSVRPEQTPAQPHELHIDLEFGDYRVGHDVADGEYQFVILVANPTRVLMTKGGGHQSIAGDSPVYYAGTAYFAIGELTRWNNDTGHYRTDVAHAHQAAAPTAGGLPYLPMTRFVAFTLPA
jgi:hypothetical protein